MKSKLHVGVHILYSGDYSGCQKAEKLAGETEKVFVNEKLATYPGSNYANMKYLMNRSRS